MKSIYSNLHSLDDVRATVLRHLVEATTRAEARQDSSI
jgi:hypothetical protein